VQREEDCTRGVEGKKGLGTHAATRRLRDEPRGGGEWKWEDSPFRQRAVARLKITMLLKEEVQLMTNPRPKNM